MKSTVLKSLRQPKSDQQLAENFEECIYVKCNLKSVKDHPFCYKHFNNHDSKKASSQGVSLPTQALLEKYRQLAGKKYEHLAATSVERNFSESQFLYENLLKRKAFFESSIETQPGQDSNGECLFGGNFSLIIFR
jgi:hypothetical protein